MSEENWFWEQEEKRQGPQSADFVKRLRKEGVITDTTLVWCDGMADWAPYRESTLFEREGPPPVPSGNRQATPNSVVLRSEMPIREAKLRPDFSPRLRSSLKRAWDLLISDFWPFVGFGALVIVILSVAMQFYLPMLFLVYPIMAGYGYYILRRIRGHRADFEDVFVGFSKYFKELALLNLILSIPTVIALVFFLFAFGVLYYFLEAEGMQGDEISIALIFAGLILSVAFTVVYFFIHTVGMFAYMLIMDCGLGWRDSMRLAWAAIKPYWFRLLVMVCLLGVISNLGMILLYVGAFVTMAWTWIAMTYWYEDAFGDNTPSAPYE